MTISEDRQKELETQMETLTSDEQGLVISFLLKERGYNFGKWEITILDKPSPHLNITPKGKMYPNIQIFCERFALYNPVLGPAY